VHAILTAHYLPRDAEVAGNAIAKLNRYRESAERKGSEFSELRKNLRTEKRGKRKRINWLTQQCR
jgi:hypothetical protein